MDGREDFERALFEKLIGAIGDKPTVRTRTFLPIEWAAILAALRIAAEQVGEREKVVAWLRNDIAPRYDKHRTAFEAIADAIERGDHSTATPVSAGRNP